MPLIIPENVRKHLHEIAKRQDEVLENKPRFISGCANDWAKLPKPGKPITVGIDGGYVRSWNDKKTNFEVIIGKSFLEGKPSKRFGFYSGQLIKIQSEDCCTF